MKVRYTFEGRERLRKGQRREREARGKKGGKGRILKGRNERREEKR